MSVPVLTRVCVPPVVLSFQEMVFCSRELVPVVSCLVTEGVWVVPVALG